MNNLSQIRFALSTRLRALRVPASLLALSVLPGAFSTAAFAATRVTSIEVSATVVSSCQVAPGLSAAAAPVSVNCTLPTPYQIDVNGGSPLQSAGRSVTGPVANGRPAYMGGRPESLSKGETTQNADDSDHGLAELTALAESQEAISAANGSADGTDAHSVRVTIVY